ncbi:MAG TPA: hypothetical protein VFR37_19050 [Longimicrobium sp.]|nr:hypothetical protein [Longimicrobium sp.]
MPDANDEVIRAAQQLYDEKDEAALELLLGMRTAAVEGNPNLAGDYSLDLAYATDTMGPLDDIKRLGRRILKRWNRQLYGLVCPKDGEETEEGKQLKESLNLGEAAVIAAVGSVLLGFGVGAAIVAPLAALIVKQFIWPAKDELCGAWGEALTDQG